MMHLNLPDGCLMGSAWKQEDFFEERFHFTANRVQKEMYGVAARMEKPGLIILGHQWEKEKRRRLWQQLRFL